MSNVKSGSWLRMLMAMAGLVVLAACASMPAQLNQPVTPLALSEVQARKVPVNGQAVRWGGVIAAVENRNSETWLEVVEQPLGNTGRPLMVDRSSGRFMVKVPGFLDPSIYAKGREFTAVGVLDGTFRSTIGKDFHYDYPVLAANGHYLWPPRVEYDTYYADPFPSYWGPGYYYPYAHRGFYDPYWYGPPRYRVDVRHPSNQPGPGPAPATSAGSGVGAPPAPLPPPAATPPAREREREQPARERREDIDNQETRIP